jgi:hypothetical protein
MRDFFEVVMGVDVNFDEKTTIEFQTSEGDEVQLMAPGDPYFDFFRDNAHGPVPLFEVDDVHVARAELEAAGVDHRRPGATAAGSGFTSRLPTATCTNSRAD